jgi:hypothetical protein
MGNSSEKFYVSEPSKLVSSCSTARDNDETDDKLEYFGQSKKKIKKPANAMNLNFCSDDIMCQNINSKKSTPDNIVLVCPEAKCVGGTCQCGKKCKKDPYTGMCCNDIEKVGNDTYCVENFGNSTSLNYSEYFR